MYVNAKGGKYDGEWLNGLKNGKGTTYHSNGDIFEGHYVNNKKHGKGKFGYNFKGNTCIQRVKFKM